MLVHNSEKLNKITDPESKKEKSLVQNLLMFLRMKVKLSKM